MTSRKELFAHYHYKWTTQNLLLSKLVNIQLCISTHDKECIKLHKHSKGLVVSIWSQMRGRSDTRREWMYENERRRKFTSACRILNCFKVEYVWIEHVDVLGHVYGNNFALHILVFYVSAENNFDHDNAFLRLISVLPTSPVLPLILHLNLALHKNRNFLTKYKKFDVFLLYSSSFFNPFIIIPKTSFLLNFKLGGSVFYIEKLFNMLIAIQISFLNINVMTLISLFFVEIQNVCCFILVDIKMVFGKSSNWWQGYELNEITFLLFKYAIHFHTQKINTLHLFYIPSKNFTSLFIFAGSIKQSNRTCITMSPVFW